jgi:hypothetical protein
MSSTIRRVEVCEHHAREVANSGLIVRNMRHLESYELLLSQLAICFAFREKP